MNQENKNLGTCGNCLSFTPDAEKPGAGLSVDSGECRRNPPRVFLVPVTTLNGEGISANSLFPKVQADCNCGMFIPMGMLKSLAQ